MRLHELERDAQVNREMFQAFLARAKETAAQSGAELPDSRIVSTATAAPSPSYPPRLLFAGLGLFGSAGLGIALAFALAAFGQGLRTVEEVEDRLGLHPIVPLPNVGAPHWLPRASAPPLGDMRWLRQAPADDDAKGHRLRPRRSAPRAWPASRSISPIPDLPRASGRYSSR